MHLPSLEALEAGNLRVLGLRKRSGSIDQNIAPVGSLFFDFATSPFATVLDVDFALPVKAPDGVFGVPGGLGQAAFVASAVGNADGNGDAVKLYDDESVSFDKNQL